MISNPKHDLSCCGEKLEKPYSYRNEICCGNKVIANPKRDLGCCGDDRHGKGVVMNYTNQFCCNKSVLNRGKGIDCCGKQIYDTNKSVCCRTADWRR